MLWMPEGWPGGCLVVGQWWCVRNRCVCAHGIPCWWSMRLWLHGRGTRPSESQGHQEVREWNLRSLREPQMKKTWGVQWPGGSLNLLLQPVPPDTRRGAKGARLGPAARLGPQPPGVRLTHRYIHRGIDDEIQAKGRKFP